MGCAVLIAAAVASFFLGGDRAPRELGGRLAEESIADGLELEDMAH